MREAKCAATVWVRDTYRYTGRSKSGFELLQKPRQCRRRAVRHGYCGPHLASILAAGLDPDKEVKRWS